MSLQVSIAQPVAYLPSHTVNIFKNTPFTRDSVRTPCAAQLGIGSQNTYTMTWQFDFRYNLDPKRCSQCNNLFDFLLGVESLVYATISICTLTTDGSEGGVTINFDSL